MAIPTFDETRIPVEGSLTFRADASYVWGLLPTVVVNMNADFKTINGWYNSIQVSYQNIQQSEADALLYRNDTKAYRDEVMGYVIPTDATYTPAQIDSLVDNHKLENFLGFNF